MLGKFLETYKKHTASLLGQHGEQRALELAVGGEYELVGFLEACLLKHYGMREHHTIVDVGCGSGRLAAQLKDSHKGRYVGIDVVPELYEHARKIAGRPDWAFGQAPGLTIPEPDGTVDYACFFSVFTHLTHEETYRYLQDTRRVLKPGGRIVMSFIEFRMASHWQFFQYPLADSEENVVLNQFIGRDALEAWAKHLDLKIVEIVDGDKRFIPIPQPVKWENGVVHEGVSNLGQSICVLDKPRSG